MIEEKTFSLKALTTATKDGNEFFSPTFMDKRSIYRRIDNYKKSIATKA